jgi:excisionase family DNA binding protein
MGDPARTSADEVRLAVALGPAELERIAQRAAEIVEARAAKAETQRPYLSVRESADYLRCSRQRVYDLLSQGALTRLKDGARVLVARAEVDAYLAGTPTGGSARKRQTGRTAPRAPRQRSDAEPTARQPPGAAPLTLC